MEDAKSEEAGRAAYPAERFGPAARVFLAALASMLLAETLAMLHVFSLPETSGAGLIFRDLAVLLLVATPLLFLTLYRPLRGYLDRMRRAEAEQRRMIQRQRATVRELSILSELLGCISTEYEQRRILDSLVRRVTDVVPCEKAALCLLGAAPGRIEQFVVSGPEKAEGCGAGCADWVFTEPFRPLLEGRSTLRLAGDELRAVLPFAFGALRSLLAVPLFSDDRVSGVLILMNRRDGDFSAEDEDTILNFAFHAYRVILIHAELARLATTDGLTGLVNHRVFQERFASEVARCVRYPRSSVSLILLDIDHFKSINDRFGHQAGDLVLRELGRMIRRMIRAVVDVAARYGGEEFAVILPETGPEDALRVAERLRREVERAEFVLEPGRVLHCSVSAGVASCPRDGREARLLIRLADEALYAAKAAGRNRVFGAAEVAAQRASGRPAC